jgi:hypothetical protein
VSPGSKHAKASITNRNKRLADSSDLHYREHSCSRAEANILLQEERKSPAIRSTTEGRDIEIQIRQQECTRESTSPVQTDDATTKALYEATREAGR